MHAKILQMYKKASILLIVATLLSSICAFGQGVENMVWKGKLEKQIGFLSSELCEGRAPGTKGGSMAAFWIIDAFRKAGLVELDGTFSHSFHFADDKVGHNILGMVPGSKKSPKNSYILVTAHYDNIGRLGEVIYPGADSNASGVATIVNLAQMFCYMKLVGRVYDSNLIFVALDGKQTNFAGATALSEQLESGALSDPISGRTITSKDIKMVINIDQIGSSMAPLNSGREDYLIMLGNHTMPKEDQDMAQFVNRIFHTDLELAFNYYGSERFTELFFKKVTELKPFVEKNIPSILFTSGITMKTNKPDDKVETLNLDVLVRRIIFIYRWIENMI